MIWLFLYLYLSSRIMTGSFTCINTWLLYQSCHWGVIQCRITTWGAEFFVIVQKENVTKQAINSLYTAKELDEKELICKRTHLSKMMEKCIILVNTLELKVKHGSFTQKMRPVFLNTSTVTMRLSDHWSVNHKHTSSEEKICTLSGHLVEYRSLKCEVNSFNKASPWSQWPGMFAGVSTHLLLTDAENAVVA